MSNVIVKPWVKVFGIICLVAGIVFGLSKLGGKSDGTTSESSFGSLGSLFSSTQKDYITVGVNTYSGFLPFLLVNNGLEPTEDCILYKDYGVKMKVVIQDDFMAGRSAFVNGDIDIIYGTLDSWCIETGDNSSMNGAKFFNVSNFSRGADAIVVNKNINTVSDLIGKTIACSEGTASHTLLLNTLETSGIGYDKVNTGNSVMPDKVNIKVVANGLEAAQVFKAGACHGAVVFSPDDKDLVESISGSKVLISTKQASNIICDGLIGKDEFLDKNREDVIKLMSALMFANEKLNTDKSSVESSAKLFAKYFGTDVDFAIDGAKNIYFMTLGDQENFFGFNNEYKGIKADEIYSKMSNTYSKLNLTKNPASWRKVSNLGLVEYLVENKNLVKGEQVAENTKSFVAPTKELETKQSISNKKVTIEYPVNGYILDNNAISVIDMEFVAIAKQFSGARVRVEGNTDNTGNYNTNVELSKKRAQSVVDYLVKTYGFDKNRFVVVGNGPKKAIEDNVSCSNQQYRTTDFQLINE